MISPIRTKGRWDGRKEGWERKKSGWMGPLNRHYFKLVYETVTRKKKKTVLKAIIVCGKREREGEGEGEEWRSGCGLQ